MYGLRNMCSSLSRGGHNGRTRVNNQSSDLHGLRVLRRRMPQRCHFRGRDEVGDAFAGELHALVPYVCNGSGNDTNRTPGF